MSLSELEVRRIQKATAKVLCAEITALLDRIVSTAPLTQELVNRVPEIRRRIASLEEIMATDPAVIKDVLELANKSVEDDWLIKRWEEHPLGDNVKSHYGDLLAIAGPMARRQFLAGYKAGKKD